MLSKLRDTCIYAAVFVFVIRGIIFGSLIDSSPRTPDAVHVVAVPFKAFPVYLTEREVAWNEGAIWVSVALAVAAMLVTVVTFFFSKGGPRRG
jgi:hypothetical protein